MAVGGKLSGKAQDLPCSSSIFRLTRTLAIYYAPTRNRLSKMQRQRQSEGLMQLPVLPEVIKYSLIFPCFQKPANITFSVPGNRASHPQDGFERGPVRALGNHHYRSAAKSVAKGKARGVAINSTRSHFDPGRCW